MVKRAQAELTRRAGRANSNGGIGPLSDELAEVAYARAAIAAHLGWRDEAVQFVREGFSRAYDLHKYIHLHNKTSLQLLRGYPPFEALLRPRE